MQLEFVFRTGRVKPPASDWLLVGNRPVRLLFVRHRRARRYVLRLQPDGSARVTIPRGGSEAEARRFATQQVDWLQRQIRRRATEPVQPRTWPVGTEIFFRGERVPLRADAASAGCWVRFAAEVLRVPDSTVDLRSAVERHLWKMAAYELPLRVQELADYHQLPVRQVTIRNQRTRWGSCSRRGTVSLNWRLVQVPIFVRDYLILHELTHLREMNHSRRFWRELEKVCPDYAEAERWLKEHSELLR